MFEAYSVAVRLSLVNQVSSGLIAMTGQFQALNRHVNANNTSLAEMERRMKSLKTQALVGGAMTAVGGFGLAMLGAPMKAAREYELAFTKFKTLNLGEAVNRQADQFARSANIMGVSGKELMNSLSESVGLFGSFDIAKTMVPKIAALNQANSAIFAGKIDGIDEGSTRALLKFIDRRGGTHDEASFLRNLDLAQRMVTGSGGFLKFKDLDQFSQRGGTAFRGLSDQGILNMALLMQEQGGSQAGNAMMSVYQNLIAGRTPKKTMAMLQEFGLGTLTMDEHATVGGKSMKSMTLKNIKAAELLQSDPATWFRTVFLDALAAKGVTSEAGIIKTTNDLLSNRTGSNQGSIMTTQLVQIMRDANLAKSAMGADQTINAYKNDPNSKFSDLHARWTDTLRELGLVVLPIAIKGAQGLTNILRTVSDFAQNHPAITRGLVGMFGALAVAASAGGAIMLAKAGFGALALALGGGSVAGIAGMAARGGLAGLATAGAAAIGVLAYSLYDLYKVSNRDGVGLSGYAKGRLADPRTRLQMDELDGDFRPNYVRPGVRNMGPQGDVYLDGKKVGTIVAPHVSSAQGRALNRPATGAPGFDGSMGIAGLPLTGGF